MKVAHQVRAFQQILNSYNGALPLHRFLFSYFKQNKQMGSSDRRWATRYIYSFFRLGKALKNADEITRLAVSDFLCNQSSSLVIEHYLPDMKDQLVLPLEKKVLLIRQRYPEFSVEEVFGFSESLSEGINVRNFWLSSFIQPDLFLRVSADHQQKIASKLAEQDIEAKLLGMTTIALPNGTKLEQVLARQGNYQVQDLSSQKTGNYFKPMPWDYWWDCCAASGGKSLLLYDLEPSIQLMVSDVRESSLNNLDDRFQEAGLKKYQKKVLDLIQNNDPDLHHYEFDGIILDAPCSGSGTWSRTPEMLSYFDHHKIAYFSKLQKTIAGNVIKYLKKGKPLIYITCSVFKEENEDVVNWMLENLALKLEKMEIISGYTEKADTMFVARLIKQTAG